MRMRPSTTIAPWPGGSTFTGFRSSSRSSGTDLDERGDALDDVERARRDRPAGCAAVAVEERRRAQLADHLGGVDVA